ncbi:MAG: redoxin family protein, partial [Phycisphaerae bacterium]
MKRVHIVPAVALLHVAVSAARAAAPVQIGDPVPPLAFSKWIKGDKVDLDQVKGKKVVLMEIWATWCQPCLISIPHLTKLQHKYKDDLVIIGATEADPRNSLGAVRRFVEGQGANMGYTVAFDADGRTTRAYMRSASIPGIPYAFLIGKDGRLAWHGSPLDPESGMEAVLESLVAGTFDARDARDHEETMRELGSVGMLAQRGQWAEARDALRSVADRHPADETAIDWMCVVHVDQLKDRDGLRAWARAHIDAHRGNARAMQRLALRLSAIEDLSFSVPDLALEAAKAAYDAGGGADFDAAATYARVLYMVGALDRAIKVQQEAVALARAPTRDTMQAVLDYYALCK